MSVHKIQGARPLWPWISYWWVPRKVLTQAKILNLTFLHPTNKKCCFNKPLNQHPSKIIQKHDLRLFTTKILKNNIDVSESQPVQTTHRNSSDRPGKRNIELTFENASYVCMRFKFHILTFVNQKYIFPFQPEYSLDCRSPHLSCLICNFQSIFYVEAFIKQLKSR